MPGDHGAEGAFAERARSRNLLVWASLHRRGLTAGGLIAAAGATTTGVLRRLRPASSRA